MSKVYRSELNPVGFLSRAAYMYPEKVAVVDGGRRYSYRELGRAVVAAGQRGGRLHPAA